MKKTLLRTYGYTVLFLAAGAAFVALGIWRGESDEVLTKAINICLECVGIG